MVVLTGRIVVPLLPANICWIKYDVDGVNELGLESRPKRVGLAISISRSWGSKWDDGTYRPLRERKILQQRRISGHLNYIAIPLKPNHIHCFSATPLHKPPELSSLCGRVATPPFPNNDGPVPGEVIELVKQPDERVWCLVVVKIDHDTRWYGRWQTIQYACGADDCEIGVGGVDGVVDLGETIGIGDASAGEVVFVTNFDVL